MNKRTFLTLLAVLVGLLALAASAALAQGSPAIDWWIVAGGGALATGPGVALNDTLGQPIVGPSGSGPEAVSLGAGYWYGAAPPTAVTLHSFAAAPQDQAIVLTWETALEVDVLGFHVYRAGAAGGPGAEPARLTAALLPATGGPAYTYVDETAAPGATYWYWLEVVDAGGGAARYGPVSATRPAPALHTIYLPLVLSGAEGLVSK
ncbi:MAG: hypothetical protein KKA73_20575 [Chloroflexi bacterium]|nr:hypothetical protein [Chloroflexota bacterium]MBU1750086.1 hypothetical protein [Chloroflexota bacterium]